MPNQPPPIWSLVERWAKMDLMPGSVAWQFRKELAYSLKNHDGFWKETFEHEVSKDILGVPPEEHDQQT